MTTQTSPSDVAAASDILTERTGAVLGIQLNRPAKKNAMTSAMYIAMADLLDDAARDESVRVVLWHGAGDSFSAGNDIGDFLNHPPAPGSASPQSRLIDAFVAFGKPIVAAVHGVAIGGGSTMLLHCDVVYAAASARFHLPFINIAAGPEFGSSYLLQLRAGYLRAAEALFLAQPFDAAKAAQLGLVTEIVPQPQLLAKARETANTLAEKPAQALQACKRLMRGALRQPLLDAIRVENENFAARLASPEAKAAFAAFLGKRAQASR